MADCKAGSVRLDAFQDCDHVRVEFPHRFDDAVVLVLSEGVEDSALTTLVTSVDQTGFTMQVGTWDANDFASDHKPETSATGAIRWVAFESGPQALMEQETTAPEDRELDLDEAFYEVIRRAAGSSVPGTRRAIPLPTAPDLLQDERPGLGSDIDDWLRDYVFKTDGSDMTPGIAGVEPDHVAEPSPCFAYPVRAASAAR